MFSFPRFEAMKFTSILITISVVFLVSSCQKNDKIRFYFYQNASAEVPYRLELDGENKGELPFLQQDPDCLNSVVQANSLILPIEKGRHRYKLINANGEVVSEGKFKFSSHEFSMTGTKGSSSFRLGEDCAATQMGE